MTLPIAPVERPLDLVGVDNGNLAADLLTTVGPSGMLHHLAARSWFALQAAAASAGFHLTYTYGGTYRTYSAQVQLFKQRYTLTYLAGRPTKQWQGQTWYQLPNTAMAAVPGTSNHGLGLAVDTAIGSDPAHATGITPQIDWMIANAPRFGWSGETQLEPWHWRYVTGDRIPAAVLAYENQQKPQPPAPQPAEDDDMDIVTNAEQFGADGPTKVKWGLTAAGKLRHLNYTEWKARGAVAGVPLTNAELSALGTV